MRGIEDYDLRGRRVSARQVWAGAISAFIGSVLIVVGLLWLVSASGVSGTLGDGALSVFFRLAGPIGVALTTASLLGLYALLLRSRSPGGVLWGSVGVVVILASLLALGWIVVHQPPLASPEVGSGGAMIPFLALTALIVAWIRPIGIMIFGVAAMLADLRGPWEYVLFAIGLLETPLPVLALLYVTGPTVTAGWQVLVLGLPGVQTGLVGAFAWLVLAVALYVSWRELRRRAARRYGGR